MRSIVLLLMSVCVVACGQSGALIRAPKPAPQSEPTQAMPRQADINANAATVGVDTVGIDTVGIDTDSPSVTDATVENAHELPPTASIVK